MALLVEIDPYAGFCGGVIKAIQCAEQFLLKYPDRRLFSLGAIVHNEEELKRLSSKGLLAANKNDILEHQAECRDSLLIRAHGEPPQTYLMAKEHGYDVVDCTCPVVLKLQKDIRAAYDRVKASGENGQIIIFGKIGHAEVLGLLGQVGGDAVVVEDTGMLMRYVFDGTVSLGGRVELFSQTTKSPEEYAEISSILSSSMACPSKLLVHETICSQVAVRHQRLTKFALEHDIVIFVSGKMSSNGSVLFALCKSLNIRTFQVGSGAELKKEWFRPDDRVGVSGATSTPKWLLEEVANDILEM